MFRLLLERLQEIRILLYVSPQGARPLLLDDKLGLVRLTRVVLPVDFGDGSDIMRSELMLVRY